MTYSDTQTFYNHQAVSGRDLTADILASVQRFATASIAAIGDIIPRWNAGSGLSQHTLRDIGMSALEAELGLHRNHHFE